MSTKVSRLTIAGGEPIGSAQVTQRCWDIVSEMEEPVEKASLFANAIALACETCGEPQASVLQRLAWTAMEQCEEIERRRGELFKLVHPDRDRFEKSGWPDEVGHTVAGEARRA